MSKAHRLIAQKIAHKIFTNKKGQLCRKLMRCVFENNDVNQEVMRNGGTLELSAFIDLVESVLVEELDLIIGDDDD